MELKGRYTARHIVRLCCAPDNHLDSAIDRRTVSSATPHPNFLRLEP